MTDPVKEYATREWVEKALLELTDTELIRLRRIAQVRLNAATHAEVADLLQEAFARILSGSRKWPLHVNLKTFIVQVMRSIASDISVQESATHFSHADGSRREASGEDDYPTDEARYGTGSEPSPEESLVAEETLAEIEDLFADDANALAVVMGRADGCSPQEIQEMFGMTELQYDSAARKVRRRLSEYKKAAVEI